MALLSEVASAHIHGYVEPIVGKWVHEEAKARGISVSKVVGEAVRDHYADRWAEEMRRRIDRVLHGGKDES